MGNWCEMDGYKLLLVQGVVGVYELVFLITSLPCGEEENTLTGGISLYPETRKYHSMIPQTTSYEMTSRVSLDCQLDFIEK